jgi:hypothetical protein
MPETAEPQRHVGPFARAAAQAPAPALVLVSIVSIQLGAAGAVHRFEALGPIGTTFLRIVFSAVLLLVATRPRIGASVRRNVGLLLLFGCVIAVMNMSFYGAIARIPLGIAVAIEFIGPLGVAVLTSRRLKDFGWVGLAVVGLVLLTPDIGGDLDPVGVGLAAADPGAGVADPVQTAQQEALHAQEGQRPLGQVVVGLGHGAHPAGGLAVAVVELAVAELQARGRQVLLAELHPGQGVLYRGCAAAVVTPRYLAAVKQRGGQPAHRVGGGVEALLVVETAVQGAVAAQRGVARRLVAPQRRALEQGVAEA